MTRIWLNFLNQLKSNAVMQLIEIIFRSNDSIDTLQSIKIELIFKSNKSTQSSNFHTRFHLLWCCNIFNFTAVNLSDEFFIVLMRTISFNKHLINVKIAVNLHRKQININVKLNRMRIHFHRNYLSQKYFFETIPILLLELILCMRNYTWLLCT